MFCIELAPGVDSRKKNILYGCISHQILCYLSGNVFGAVQIIRDTIVQGSISLTFYAQLLPLQIPKLQKDSQLKQLFALLGSALAKAVLNRVDEILWCHKILDRGIASTLLSRLHYVCSSNQTRIK